MARRAPEAMAVGRMLLAVSVLGALVWVLAGYGVMCVARWL
jgi:hypothetical protein